jgi:hypothetical protein
MANGQVFNSLFEILLFLMNSSDNQTPTIRVLRDLFVISFHFWCCKAEGLKKKVKRQNFESDTK